MDNIFAYLRSRWQLLLFYGIVLAILLLTAFLGNQDMGLALYAAAMLTFMLVLLLLAEGSRFCGRLRLLQRLLQRLGALPSGLPRPDGAMEAAYGALIEELSQQGAALRRALEKNQADSLAYYTLWVHQIKTPIAAMRLLLRDEPLDRELGAELFRIERYVELVLSYLRLGGDASDYVICRQSLDPILKRAARKYATLFIRGRVSLDLRDTGLEVLTDGKWLQLAVEQLLSNAVKYAPGGKVSVYARGEDLVVEDNGAGIPTEDLPRIFEKGFTGGNGRLEGQSTGIGLYLCREICRRLGHTLSVESQPGRGSRFIVDLARPYLEVE